MIDYPADDRAAMRHVPPVEYLIFKIDVDYRSRIEKLLRAFEETTELDQQERKALAAGFSALAQSIERFAEVLHGARTFHPDDLRGRLEAGLANATHALLATQADSFRNRAPLNQFERAIGEYALGAFLVVATQIRRLSEAVGAVAPGVWEELLSGTPAAEPRPPIETLQPIA